jgi:FlaG/FlaF family flagellin (archaellin)
MPTHKTVVGFGRTQTARLADSTARPRYRLYTTSRDETLPVFKPINYSVPFTIEPVPIQTMTGSRFAGDPGERAVSTTIGVVLMVAVVVILASVVSFAVLNLERTNPTTPTFSKVHDYNRNTAVDGQYLNVTHGSGETVQTRDMTLVITGAKDGDTATTATLTDDDHIGSQVGEEWSASEQLTISAKMFEAGGSDLSDYLNLRGAQVKIVWVPENEDYSDVLFRWEGPDA